MSSTRDKARDSGLVSWASTTLFRSASSIAPPAPREAPKPSSILKPSKYGAGPPSLNEPLIPRSQTRATGSESSEDEFEEDGFASARPRSVDGILPTNVSQKGLFSIVGVGVLATAGMAAAAAAIVVHTSAAVILMGGVCIANAPVMGIKQLVIAKSAGIKDTVNMIREESGLLQDEVDFVQQTVNDLQAEANSLKAVESNLQKIAEEQGTNVDSLVQLVNENESILDQMRKNLKETFAAAVTDIVIRSDADGDMKIDVKELPLLSLRLSMHLEELGVEMDMGMFEDMVREDNDISNVIKFCADLMYAEDKQDTGDDDESVDSQLTFDFEAFVQTLDDEGSQKITRQERLSMVRLNEKYTQGAVEVARGGRPLLARQSFTNLEKRNERKTKVNQVKRRQTKMQSRTNASRETRVTLGGLVVIKGTSAEC